MSSMSIRIRGSNSYGHVGWLSYKCAICSTTVVVGSPIPHRSIAYRCPKDMTKFNAYFCEADARGLKYKCPYCGSDLEMV